MAITRWRFPLPNRCDAPGAQRLTLEELPNERMSAPFQAGVESVEEAVYNSMLMATTESGNGVTVQAIPLGQLREVLERHGIQPKR